MGGALDVLRTASGPLQARAAETVARIVERTYAEVPGYRDVPREDFEPATVQSVEFVAGAFAEGRAPASRDDWSFDEEVVRRRIRQGVGATDWLHHAGIFAEEVQAAIVDAAREIGVPEAELTAAVMEVWAMVRGSVSFTAARFEEAAQEIVRQDSDRRAKVLAGLLHGTLTPAELRTRAAGVDLDPDSLHMAVRARPLTREGGGTLLTALMRAEPTVGPRAIWAEVDGDVCGLTARRPEPREGVVLGVGASVALAAAAESYAEATAALETAWRFKRAGVHRLDDLGLLPSVIAGGRPGDRLVERLVDAVEREGAAGTALVDTVAAYLESGLRPGETSAALHLHPNSLRKRLRRYEQLTGASLGSVDDLAAVWWALKRRELARSTVPPLEPLA